MANNKKYKGSLSLDWINKDQSLYYEIDEKEGKGVRPVWVPRNDIRVAEPRILRFMKEYGDKTSGNMLVRGDNLLVLRSLAEMFKGRKEQDKVKCVYIDPPYNTGNAFKHYDDNLQHSQWMTMVRDRLVLLKKLLRRDGFIFVQINDEEAAYLKVILDEVFGRSNYVGTLNIQMRHPDIILRGDKELHSVMEYVYIFSNTPISKLNKRSQEKGYDDYRYEVVIKGKPDTIKEIGGKKIAVYTPKKFSLKEHKKGSKNYLRIYNIGGGKLAVSSSTGRFYEKYIKPDVGKFKPRSLLRIENMGADGLGYRDILLPEAGRAIANYFQAPPIKYTGIKKIPFANYYNFVSEVRVKAARQGGVPFPESKKAEEIIEQILLMSSEESDIILDSFAGSGTTGAVAHKMDRRWIMIELGDHAERLCIKRMNNVVRGDQTGISEKYKFKGGGGFKYYKLGESVIYEHDMNWKMKEEEMAEAVFLHFQYKPEKSDLEKNGIYLGKHRSTRYHFALSFATRETKMITEKQYEEIIKYLDKEKRFKHLTIFTNVPVAVSPDIVDERVLVEKIPAKILREYNLL